MVKEEHIRLVVEQTIRLLLEKGFFPEGENIMKSTQEWTPEIIKRLVLKGDAYTIEKPEINFL